MQALNTTEHNHDEHQPDGQNLFSWAKYIKVLPTSGQLMTLKLASYSYFHYCTNSSDQPASSPVDVSDFQITRLKPTYALYFHTQSQLALHMFWLQEAIIRGSQVYTYYTSISSSNNVSYITHNTSI